MSTYSSRRGSGPADERILAAAANLFALFGYNGVSTRDIAIGAGVNEVTIYRHYRRKRDLYCAVLESALKNVQLRGDLLADLAAATDERAAMNRAFELVSTMLRQNADLMRLLQFSALELADDVIPLFRKHLAELVEVIARYLEPWIEHGGLQGSDSRALVVTMAMIVCSGHSFSRIFAAEFKDQQRVFCAFAGAPATRESALIDGSKPAPNTGSERRSTTEKVALNEPAMEQGVPSQATSL